MKEPGIAKEGLRLIIPSFALAVVLLLGGFFILSLLVFCFVLFCLFFFRNPRRQTDAGPGKLISPADGTVVDIREVVEEEFLGGAAVTRVAIFMSPMDVHVNRAPCAGRIISMVHKAGKFALAFKKDIDQGNERNCILFEDNGERVLIIQIAGFLARRIIPYVKVDNRVEQGQPVGIIAFGSRVDIYFHKGYRPVVNLNDKVKAGITVVAQK